MIDYGVGPLATDVELVLFGPGYGEAVAVHFGDGRWILVDSCIDPQARRPAAIQYLNAIGVELSCVAVIVASHWHDDHVRGISEVAASCPSAEFVLSGVFNNREAASFAAAYSGKSSAGLSRGAKELYTVVQSHKKVSFALHKSIVLQENISGREVIATALSPLSDAFAQCVVRMRQYKARVGGATNNAPDLQPNMEAVAIHIDLGEDAILLGADLEEHEKYGWSAIVADKWSGSRRGASAFKVAHHGSYTGDCSKVWSTLLEPSPVACVTPFNLGNLRLPTETDRARLRSKTAHCYISSGGTRKPDMDSRLLKHLSRVCKNIAVANSGFGAIRLRKARGASTWNVQLFGAAEHLLDASA